MASNGKASTDANKFAMESEALAMGTSPPANLFVTDLALRFVLLLTTGTSLGIMLSSKQTKTISSPLLPEPISLEAKFTYSPAIVYFVAAISAACLYSLLSIIVSISVVSKKSPPSKLLLYLSSLDAVVTAVVASATGAVTSVAYIGMKGNSHIGWNKICHVFDKFCRHVGISITFSLAATWVLLMLVATSTYSLHRRSSSSRTTPRH